MVFGKSNKTEKSSEIKNDVKVPKWPHPKILLIDLDEDVAIALKAEGYNISIGSFGLPYKVPKNDGRQPVIFNGAKLPNHTEQEIFVIDLLSRKPTDKPEGEKVTSNGENDWWASCSSGVIDPRPRVMVSVRKAFDRILTHGGFLIIFADSRLKQDQVFGYLEYNRVVQDRVIEADNWGFLSILDSDNLEIRYDHGHEMAAKDNKSPIGQLISEHLKDANFTCTLHMIPYSAIKNDDWKILATNKFKAPVACAIAVGEKGGWVFILPQISDKPKFLTKFVNNILPDLSPHLFPDFEGATWIYRSEYELPKIQELKNEIHRVEENAKQMVKLLNEEIESARNKMSYLYDLLRETGHPLVVSVKKTLEILGFQSVLDVDAEMEKKGDTGPKREDLQIHDQSPTLLVEVKGIGSLPRDAEALQVWKYFAPRMREWGRTDIQGLSIINHQKNIPALERENNVPFRDDILTNAEEHKFGLLTTWDLFRLTRSYLKNGWTHEHIKQLFYKHGRIEPIPQHYEYVGVVENFWENHNAVGVRIECGAINIGERIAFEFPVELEEQKIESLQVEKANVSKAVSGDLAGIKTALTKIQAKKGVRVFRIKEA